MSETTGKETEAPEYLGLTEFLLVTQENENGLFLIRGSEIVRPWILEIGIEEIQEDMTDLATTDSLIVKDQTEVGTTEIQGLDRGSRGVHPKGEYNFHIFPGFSSSVPLNEKHKY